MNYKLWDNNLILPLSIQQQKNGGQIETFFQFNKYGSNGRILEQQKNNNEKEVFLWSYNNTYPVLKATGTTYDQLSQFISQSQIESAATNFDDQSLQNQLNTTRSNLPNAFIESYSYKPLVGITSKVDASGHFTYFEYDGFNRLKRIRDQNSYILKQNQYAYTDASIGSSIVPIYLNSEQSSNFQKNDCSTGFGSWVNYKVPAGKYCSFISVSDANNLAMNEIASLAQSFANTTGACTLCASCTGVSNRSITGYCQSVNKVYTASKFDYTSSSYICTYHFEWSDGFWSSNYTENSSTNCLNQILVD
jgi:YD repeat-containing protein